MFARCLDGFSALCLVAFQSSHHVGLLDLLLVILLACLPVDLLPLWHAALLPVKLYDVLTCLIVCMLACLHAELLAWQWTQGDKKAGQGSTHIHCPSYT